ncbi:MAG: bifunctional serine/threonine-protein kinase/formylglycine-generating enzyme family protein [Planctomycetota bacterium]
MWEPRPDESDAGSETQPDGSPHTPTDSRVDGVVQGAVDSQLVEEICVRCVESTEPEAELARCTAGRPELRARVERILGRLSQDQERLGFAPSEGPRPLAETAPAPGRAGTQSESSVGWADTPSAPASREDSTTGENFGRFHLLRCLGQGGMGAVYHAFDKRLRREVALKQIRGEALLLPQFRQRFAREAQAASRLNHPNLCTVYDSGEVDGVPFIAMQLVPGTSLDRRMARAAQGREPLLPGIQATHASPSTRAEFDAVVDFFETLARALHHAHERGLVHRDIKPANVMVTTEGEPVVLDFGLVRDDRAGDDGLTLSGAVMGSPPYMAPEQIAPGQTPVDARADVYSLGVTLYNVVTGALPFEGVSLHDLTKAVLRAAPKRVRALNKAAPRDLEVIVERAMDRDPSHRYQTAAALADDLRRLRRHEPILARRASPALRTGRWVQRNPVLSAFLLTVTVGFGVSLSQFLRAETNLARFTQLASVRRLAVAEREASKLYPPWPATLPALRAWLRDHAAPLRASRPEVVAQQKALQARLGAGAHTSAAADSERFLLETLDDHVPDLLHFLQDDDGTVADVERRVAWAETIAARSVDAHRAAWEATVAGVAASPRYAGLRLAPQLGLEPLGADPHSGLFEFHHLASAAAGAPTPTRDPITGRLVLDADSGMVFVLLPSGSFRMGEAPATGANPDPTVQPDQDEVPVHQVALDAFFLAKHELTQAQWQRLTRGATPSFFGLYYNAQMPEGLPRITATNPVESVRWSECREILRRVGLLLPTEAQWEYACRAGSTTRYFWGDDRSRFSEFGNGADRFVRPHVRDWAFIEDDWYDGHIVHAPVGSFAANGFGLHDMAGNVAEWCLDAEAAYTTAPRAGDGLRGDPDAPGASSLRIDRGGHFQSPASNVRSADRGENQDMPTNVIGVRPARAVLPRD